MQQGPEKILTLLTLAGPNYSENFPSAVAGRRRIKVCDRLVSINKNNM